MNTKWINQYFIELSTVLSNNQIIIKALYKSGIHVGELIIDTKDDKNIISKIFVKEDYRNLGLACGMIGFAQNITEQDIKIYEDQDPQVQSFLKYYLSIKG